MAAARSQARRRAHRPRRGATLCTLLVWGAGLAAAQAAPASAPEATPAVGEAASLAPTTQRGADFRLEPASADARRLAGWVAASRDNGDLPFIVIDKVAAKVFVFDAQARLRGASTALLGRAKGDDTVPGIGARPLRSIRPEERTTPAGRFVAFKGQDFKHDILWVDYGAGIALHRVVAGDPGDHRLARLASPSTSDKRISYGCINVPAAFYDTVVMGSLTAATINVYILPETKRLESVFPVEPRPGDQAGADRDRRTS